MNVEKLAPMVERLYATEEFQEVIVRNFIDDGIHQFCLNDNVDTEGVRDELKARKILNDYLLYIVEANEILKAEKKN